MPRKVKIPFAVIPRNLIPVVFVAIVVILMIIMLLTLISTGQLDSFIALAIIAFSSLVMAGFVFFFIRVVRSQQETVTIALLGVRGSGKTVYATMLFAYLRTHETERISFRPYGTETRQRVTEYHSLLQSREWPPRTTTASVFHYGAVATLRYGLFKNDYKILIPDYEGEDTEAIAKMSSMKEAYRSDFFRQVVESDAVMLLVDCEFLLTAGGTEIDKFENAMISAVEEMVEQKGVPGGTRMKAPLAIIFTKADVLLSEAERSDVVERKASRLIAFCNRICKNVRIFQVSAVGGVTEDGLPAAELRPVGIADPLVWLLSRIGGFPAQ